MIDVQAYYRKLANHEAITEEEIVDLLRELDDFRKSSAWLASCAAATLEGLPKSTALSRWDRHLRICETAAKALKGDLSGIAYPSTVDAARERCEKAIGRGRGA